MLAIALLIAAFGCSSPADPPGGSRSPTVAALPAPPSPEPSTSVDVPPSSLVADLPSTPDTWSRFSLVPHSSNAVVADITPGGPGLVAVGWRRADDPLAKPTPVVWTSSDGRAWTRVPGKSLGSGYMEDVSVGGPGLIAVGGTALCIPCGNEPGGNEPVLWTSEEGLEWSRAMGRMIPGGAITAGGPGLIAIGDEGGARFSTDGLNWERASMPRVLWAEPTHMAAADDRLITVGDYQQQVAIWTSTDGMTWTYVPVRLDVFPRGLEIRGVTYGPHGFVAVGDDREGLSPAVWTSDDGLHWRRAAAEAFVSDVSAPPEGGTFMSMWAVAADDKGYVAVGADRCPQASGGNCGPAQTAVWTSSDGSLWFRVAPDPVFEGGVHKVIAWGSRFVMMGEHDGASAVWISE